MARLGKNDIVSIEDLTTVDIERIFELADSFATGLERGETMGELWQKHKAPLK